MPMLKPGYDSLANSIIYNLDPRTKLLYTFYIVSANLLSANPYLIFFNLGSLILLMYLSQIPMMQIYSRVKSMFFLVFLIFFFQSILTKGEPLFQIGQFTFSREGVLLGLLTVVRILAIYLCSLLLTMTTSPMKLAAGLESLFSPLGKLGIPIQQWSMMISISLLFIPIMIQEAEQIKIAQKSRGAPFDFKNLFLKLKSLLSVLLPVLASSLQRAHELSIAMESRCYHPQSHLKMAGQLHFETADKIFISTILFMLMGTILSHLLY